ncbi:MAG: hypothetical protein J5659_01300 [Clostridia bacterium]|nr:hypothetical protein [Clostridia bacterium]
MKQNISLWQFSGFAVTALLGALLHYLYDWSGKSIIIAPFSGIDESTWEHMKLLYFPLLTFALFQSFFFKGYGNFWCIKLRGVLTGLLAIPVIFYTYNGALGKSPDWINIVIFFVAAALPFITEAYFLKKGKSDCKHPHLAFAAICLIGVMFVFFTFYKPNIPIFKDN